MTRRWRSIRRSFLSGSLAPLSLLALASAGAAQVGTVQSEQKISQTAGGFGGILDPQDYFGFSVASVGDLDGDGITDLAVGAFHDDDGVGSNLGAVWILFLNADGTVASEQKISATEGSFDGSLGGRDWFGWSVAGLGDLDGDGNEDLAVGAIGDDDGGTDQGAVWVLFLNSDGTVASEQKISATEGGFGGDLDLVDQFGASVAALGDLDGDGVGDLAVGADGDDDGGGCCEGRGAVWILFMNPDGTVASEQKISATAGGFAGILDPDDRFSASVAALGDLDGDGNTELAVGAHGDDDGLNAGAVWILFLNSDGTVISEQKISATAGGFGGTLDPGERFGRSVASLGDLDGDGITDLAVGAEWDDGGQGAVWILFLNPDGTVAAEQRISETEGGFGGILDTGNQFTISDQFGVSVASLGDLDGDGETELAVGAWGDDDGKAPGQVSDRGAVWMLFLEGPPRGKTRRSTEPLGSAEFPVAFQADPTAPPTTQRGDVLELDVEGVALRNGSGANELSFRSAFPPRAGAEWQAWVDVSAHPRARASLVLASDRALSGTPSRFGELLIDVVSKEPLFTSFVASGGATDVHVLTMPAELLGQGFSLQALILDGPASALTNAIDLVIGPRSPGDRSVPWQRPARPSAGRGSG